MAVYKLCFILCKQTMAVYKKSRLKGTGAGRFPAGEPVLHVAVAHSGCGSVRPVPRAGSLEF